MNTPAKEVSKVSRGEASDRAPSQDRSSFSVAAVEKAWSEAVAAVYGGRYPALAPQKSHLEAVIRFGEKNGFSPVDYVRWFVANWDSLRHGVKTNWMNLAEFPVFSSITHLRDKALPFFLAAVEHPEAWEKRLLTKEERQRQSEEASRKWEAERPQREAEARKRAEAQVLEARMKRYTTDRDYYRPEEVPADHPQREGILNYTRNGIPVRANSYTYERLDDISLREARQGGFRTYSRG